MRPVVFDAVCWDEETHKLFYVFAGRKLNAHFSFFFACNLSHLCLALRMSRRRRLTRVLCKARALVKQSGNKRLDHRGSSVNYACGKCFVYKLLKALFCERSFDCTTNAVADLRRHTLLRRFENQIIVQTSCDSSQLRLSARTESRILFFFFASRYSSR